jgi:hypothetical protein
MSQLRLAALIIAFLLVFFGGRALRKELDGAFGPVFVIVAGIVLAVVALFPAVATIITELLAIGEYPGSRLIALLVLTSIAVIVYTANLAGRITTLNRQLDTFFRETVVRGFIQAHPNLPEDAILCVVPAHNEAANLPTVLPRFPSKVDGRPLLVLVVDDGSTDSTGSIVLEHRCLLARLPVNRGGGAALRTGFDIARAARAKIIVTIDADGQNDPEAVPMLVGPILAGEADIVIGSRILGGHEVTHWWRHVGVIVFSNLINFLMGTKITDCSSGFRAIRAECIASLRLLQDQYHTSEFLILSAKRGLTIKERPIVFRRRYSGRSKKGPEILYAFRFFYVLTTTWLRGR